MCYQVDTISVSVLLNNLLGTSTEVFVSTELVSFATFELVLTGSKKQIEKVFFSSFILMVTRLLKDNCVIYTLENEKIFTIYLLVI